MAFCTVACVHGQETNLDEYVLAGIDLSNENKEKLKIMGVTASMLITMTGGSFLEKDKEIRKIVKESNPPKSKKKIKNWEKKRFWE